jgi:hypothetical protein
MSKGIVDVDVMFRGFQQIIKGVEELSLDTQKNENIKGLVAEQRSTAQHKWHHKV